MTKISHITVGTVTLQTIPLVSGNTSSISPFSHRPRCTSLSNTNTRCPTLKVVSISHQSFPNDTCQLLEMLPPCFVAICILWDSFAYFNGFWRIRNIWFGV